MLVDPRLELVPCPAIHPDLASLAALSAAHEHSPSGSVQVAFLVRERRAGPEAGAPQEHDERAESMSVGAVADGSHHRHDLFVGRRISRVLLALVSRGTPSVVPRHRRWRAAMAGGVEQHGLHGFLPCGGWLDNPWLYCHREYMSTIKEDRLQIRVGPSDKALLERAAAASHLNVSAFVVQAAASRAEEVLAERSSIRLSGEAATAFTEALERPAEVNERLASAMRRKRKFSWLD